MRDVTSPARETHRATGCKRLQQSRASHLLCCSFSQKHPNPQPLTHAREHTLYRCPAVSPTPEDNSRFDLGGRQLTFGGEDLGGELQSLDVLRPNVLQADGQALRLSVEELDGHCAGQLLLGHWWGGVGRPAQVQEEEEISDCLKVLEASI